MSGAGMWLGGGSMRMFGCDSKAWRKCRLELEYQPNLNTIFVLLEISVGTGVMYV